MSGLLFCSQHQQIVSLVLLYMNRTSCNNNSTLTRECLPKSSSEQITPPDTRQMHFHRCRPPKQPTCSDHAWQDAAPLQKSTQSTTERTHDQKASNRTRRIINSASQSPLPQRPRHICLFCASPPLPSCFHASMYTLSLSPSHPFLPTNLITKKDKQFFCTRKPPSPAPSQPTQSNPRSPFPSHPNSNKAALQEQRVNGVLTARKGKRRKTNPCVPRQQQQTRQQQR